MRAPWSYLLCATPRTGSTLLCSLLKSTGVAGRPESYFREPNERAWAERLGISVAGKRAVDYQAFVTAARQAGSTPNGVFGARVMWGTIRPLVERLPRLRMGEHHAEVLADAFGPIRFVHLRRGDVVEQAVSWARAEKTGYWQQADVTSAVPALDLDQVDQLVQTIAVHKDAWESWFAEQGVEPHRVTYEELVAAPDRTVREVLGHLNITASPAWRPPSEVRRQADEINADWVRRFRAANGAQH